MYTLGPLGPALAEAPLSYTNEIAPGVYSFGGGNGYHSMFLVTDDGVAVFETVNTAHASGLLTAIKEVTDQPVKYAFHSHNHWDHSGGGKVFQDVGAETVMHSDAAGWLAAHPGQETSPPDEIWDGNEKTYKLGGKTIELHHLGLNHGLGMTVFVLPDSKTAYIADLVTPNRVMFTIAPDFNIREWERSLDEIMELNFDVAVCSHNELPPAEVVKGCTKEHVQASGQYIEDLRAAIFKGFETGAGPEEVVANISLPQYAHWGHYDDWLQMNAWRVMLDLWMGPYPWYPQN